MVVCKRTVHQFEVDLPQSDACFDNAYLAETTESFCDGRVSEFSFLGGVPWGILDDSTKLAVAKVLGDCRRKRTRVFSKLQSHYLSDDGLGRPGMGATATTAELALKLEQEMGQDHNLISPSIPEEQREVHRLEPHQRLTTSSNRVLSTVKSGPLEGIRTNVWSNGCNVLGNRSAPVDWLLLSWSAFQLRLTYAP